MNKNPLISIIIPAYNHEKYVEQCLNSVLEEDYPNKEIIIINDGSKDSTEEVIKSWIKLHGNDIPIIFKSRENKGITKTLNELLDLASGEYIVLLASDDCLANNGIRKRYEYLKHHPDKMAVFGDFTVINENNKILFNSGIEDFLKKDKSKLLTDKNLREQIILNWPIVSGSVVLVKKEIFDVIGKYDESLMADDWDVYLRMVSKNLFVYFEGIVDYYRWHGNNTCSNKYESFKNDKKVVMKNMKLFGFKEKLYLLNKYIVLTELSFIDKAKKEKEKEKENNYFVSTILISMFLFVNFIIKLIRKFIINIIQICHPVFRNNI